MSFQGCARWIFSMVCVFVLAPSSPSALAQRRAAFDQAQGQAGPRGSQASDKQPTGSESAQPPVATDSSSSVDAREIKIESRPVRGAKNAKVTIVLFDDFQCPYAAYMYKTLFEEVLKDYADRVKVVLRETPNTEIHTWAKHAAINAECLAAQNDDAYWAFVDYVHAHQREIGVDPAAALDKAAIEQAQKHNLLVPPLQKCIETQSDELFKALRSEAIHRLGVREVPTLLINGEKLLGSHTAEPLREAIDRALHDAGQPVLPPAAVAPDVGKPTESQQHLLESSNSSSELGRSDMTQDDAAAYATSPPKPLETRASRGH
jgi:protein-disulfide isomerase